MLMQWALAGVYWYGESRVSSEVPWPRHALVLTAHPDDECMFFGPVIQSLLAHNVSVSALCLSQGNADGLGAERALELQRSYSVLGVRPYDVTCLNDTALQDGMDAHWDAHHISSVLDTYLQAHSGIDAIITFDANGVSLHPNHRATYRGARNYAHERSRLSGEALALWTLASQTWHTKYLGPISAMWDWAAAYRNRDRNTLLFLASWQSYLASLTAMRQHTTQLVWFRYLYVIFSSYMQCNKFHTSLDKSTNT